MLALIDLDPLPYAYGGLTFEDGELMPDSMLQRKVDDKIKKIMERAGATSWTGYLTDSASNFRNDVATILPYKGNRSGNAKPARWAMLRDYLLDTYPDNVSLVKGMEADDALAIDQYENLSISANLPADHEDFHNTIICTIDKDLKMVPGWHYNWQHDEVSFVEEIDGLRFFYQQLLTGDMTDNIKGLFGVGPKSTLVKKLSELDTEEAMFKHVYSAYEDRFGSYAIRFLEENARLLWMLTHPDERIGDKMQDMHFQTNIYKEKQEDDDIPF